VKVKSADCNRVKALDMPRTVYYGSRWKAAVGSVLCLAFIALGYWLIHFSTIKSIIAGWLAIIVFGAFFPLWVAAIFRPNRLSITNEGFSVRQVLFGTRKYYWMDVEQISVCGRYAANLVVWTYKVRPKKLAKFKAVIGQPNDYDGYLPAGWQISASDIAAEMNAARQNFDRTLT
jgi:hypothetical protein